MLQEAPVNAPLGATGNLAALHHQFIAGRRDKTWRIRFIGKRRRFARVWRKNRGNSEAVIPEAQSFGNAFVISINGVAEGFGVVGYDGVSKFVVVENGASACRTMNDIDAV